MTAEKHKEKQYSPSQTGEDISVIAVHLPLACSLLSPLNQRTQAYVTLELTLGATWTKGKFARFVYICAQSAVAIDRTIDRRVIIQSTR